MYATRAKDGLHLLISRMAPRARTGLGFDRGGEFARSKPPGRGDAVRTQAIG